MMFIMITCSECIQELYPDDPRVKSGRYHLCDCDYCSKSDYYRGLEQQQAKPFVPRPVVNITYQVENMNSIPYFKAIREEISLLKGRLSKYFESKRDRL